MKIYFNGIELIALGVVIICALFISVCKLLDKWCNSHWGHPVQKWLYRFLYKK